jgi:hypothetical protein
LYRGSDADEYFIEPAGIEMKKRQPSPNTDVGRTSVWGYREDLYHSFMKMKRSYYLTDNKNRM